VKYLSLTLTLCAGLFACNDEGANRPVAVSIIGSSVRGVDFNAGPSELGNQMIASAVRQGLVAFNPSGEIVPALAESWIVTDDGLSYIFRLKRLDWSGGKPVTAPEVAASLRLSLRAASRNPAKVYFSGVTEILAMTDRVIEIRLAMPQPYILQLLARPEMGVVNGAQGTGPMVVKSQENGSARLRPVVAKVDDETAQTSVGKADEVHITSDGAARAITRFARGDATAVLGGDFTNIPLVLARGLPSDVIRRDPAAGLFGLVASKSSTELEQPYVRRALAMSIDRQALVARFRLANWRPLETLLPRASGGVASDAQPEWLGFSMDERRNRARQILRGVYAVGTTPSFRISMPRGPGARLLFAQLKADWALIGVKLENAKSGEIADLILVDSVAAYNGLGWYFGRLACGQGFHCSEDGDAALAKAKQATSDADRTEALAEAHRALASAQIFIPIAFPLRWSLAGPDLPGFRENPSNFHPISALKAVTR
jgi:oligopeptide transport system substrate-binding protein